MTLQCVAKWILRQIEACNMYAIYEVRDEMRGRKIREDLCM